MAAAQTVRSEPTVAPKLSYNEVSNEKVREMSRKVLTMDFIDKKNLSAISTLADSIAAQVSIDELDNKVSKSTAQSRLTSVKNVLGDGLHAQLEAKFLSMLKKPTDDAEKILCLDMLGRALASENAVPAIQEAFRSATALMLRDEATADDVEPAVIFGISTALCYLGHDAGTIALDSALGSDDVPLEMKKVAINALGALATRESRSVLLRFSESGFARENAMLARALLDALKSVENMDSALIPIACTQLDGLSLKARSRALDHYELGLLIGVSSVIRRGIEENMIDSVTNEIIKKHAANLLRAGRRPEQEMLAPMFHHFAWNEHQDVVKFFLTSESSFARFSGILSILKLEAKFQRQFLPDLISALNDDYQPARDIAQYVICRIKGESARNHLSDEEFEIQSARLKAWWKLHGDNGQ